MKIETSAPLEFRATIIGLPHRQYHFTFEDIWFHDIWDCACITTADDTVILKKCHIDQSTGYTDSQGVKVFGGDVVEFDNRRRPVNPERGDATIKMIDVDDDVVYAVIEWGGSGFIAWGSAAEYDADFRFDWGISAYPKRVIGNIHNVDALPEEVRKMVEEVK